MSEREGIHSRSAMMRFFLRKKVVQEKDWEPSHVCKLFQQQREDNVNMVLTNQPSQMKMFNVDRLLRGPESQLGEQHEPCP